MICPNCGSEDNQILKKKGENIKELLLKCENCGNTFREIITQPKPIEVRVIISKFESSEKSWASFLPDEIISTDDILEIGSEMVRVTSLENKRGGRVNECLVDDLVTIWATSIDIPARVGVSIDMHGKVLSHKVDIDRDFKFTIGDVARIDGITFKIRSIKTLERKMRRGFAYADVSKRVYGRPVDDKRFNYDLSSKVVR
jgi:uncharacterized Zn finger protein